MAQIREMLDQSQEAQTKEQLQFLINAAQGKLNEQKEKLEKVFLNPSAEEHIRVIPDTQIRWYDEYRCNVKDGTSKSIDDVVDAFFTGGDGLLNGFKSLVKTGLSTILGNEQAGESQQNIYIVGMEHNAIIRVDISSWRYNYSSDGIIGKVKDVYCCTFCKSVVDHTKVRLDTLVYLISELAGDDIAKLEDYINKLKRIWKLLENESPDEVYDRVMPLLNQRHEAWLRLNKI
ncbi:hypothetical protein E1L25_26620 [Salmonella enterica subsp. enterica serovar Newport]|nr:hypothetical protein [Salmonella enterica subsp. enterica serovar Newport]